jgi:hypothetical protein
MPAWQRPRSAHRFLAAFATPSSTLSSTPRPVKPPSRAGAPLPIRPPFTDNPGVSLMER